MSTVGFLGMYAGHGGVVKKYFRHCIVGKIQDGRQLDMIIFEEQRGTQRLPQLILPTENSFQTQLGQATSTLQYVIYRTSLKMSSPQKHVGPIY